MLLNAGSVAQLLFRVQLDEALKDEMAPVALRQVPVEAGHMLPLEVKMSHEHSPLQNDEPYPPAHLMKSARSENTSEQSSEMESTVRAGEPFVQDSTPACR